MENIIRKEAAPFPTLISKPVHSIVGVSNLHRTIRIVKTACLLKSDLDPYCPSEQLKSPLAPHHSVHHTITEKL